MKAEKAEVSGDVAVREADTLCRRGNEVEGRDGSKDSQVTRP